MVSRIPPKTTSTPPPTQRGNATGRRAIFFFGLLMGVTITQIFYIVMPGSSASSYVSLSSGWQEQASGQQQQPQVVASQEEEEEQQQQQQNVVVAKSVVKEDPPLKVVAKSVVKESSLYDNATSAQTRASVATSAPSVATPTKTTQKPPQDTPNNNIVDFEHQPDVAIVVKIHGTQQWMQLMQSQCLLQAAYNNRTNYDVVVFLSEHVPDEDVQKLQAIIAPAKLKVELDHPDHPTLQAMLDALTDAQKESLIKNCQNVNSTADIQWNTPCQNPGYGNVHMSYLWQAEFRAKHIWMHPVLADYKYMLWFDSDAFPTKKWNRDPVAELIRHDLVFLMDNYPIRYIGGDDLQAKFQAAFNDKNNLRNRTLCEIKFSEEKGHIVTQYGQDGTCPNQKKNPHTWGIVHGFFHLSNLDFMRSEVPQRWFHELIGDTRFVRRYDDQIAITVPPAVLAPERSWALNNKQLGIQLDVLHNGVLDGRRVWRTDEPKPGFWKAFWNEIGQYQFPEALELNCPLSNPG